MRLLLPSGKNPDRVPVDIETQIYVPPAQKGGRRLLLLSFARAVATIMVVLFHAQGIARLRGAGSWFTEIFRTYGYAPVEFFFVLSGFIIMHAHHGDIGKPARIRNYVTRRLARVYPMYWCLCLVLVPACVLLSSWVTTQGKQSISGILLSLLLLPQPGIPLLGVTWTVPYELLFYSVFSLLIIRRTYGLIAFGCWTVAVCGWNLFGSGLWPFNFLFSIHNVAFILGGAAAWSLRRGLVVWRPHVVVALGLSGFGLTILFNVFARGFRPAEKGELFFYIVSCVAITAGLAAVDCTAGVRIPQFMESIANASYSIYLCHYPVLLVLARFAGRAGIPALLLFPLLSVLGIVAGIVLFRYVEDPLVKRVLRIDENRVAGSYKASPVLTTMDAELLSSGAGVNRMVNSHG